VLRVEGLFVPFGFEVVEKPADEGSVELADVKVRGAGVGVLWCRR
jgi:hypothetical protein